MAGGTVAYGPKLVVFDDTADPALDEDAHEVRTRELQEQTGGRIRQSLDDPQRSRAVLQQLALWSRQLSGMQFMVLCALMDYANKDLTNAFPHRSTVATGLGLKLAGYDRHLGALRASGWVITHMLRRANGKVSTTGVQFCVPATAMPDRTAWVGPVVFTGHDASVRRRKKR